ncbi:MAG: hypothetical protein ABSE43_12975 [Steroidobacteraceae bacterium]
MRMHITATAGIAMLGLTLAGCAGMGGGGAAKPDNAPAAAAPATSKVGPGMDANGVVIDATKVESGYGQKVKGLGDWDGEITGVVIPGSPFSKLQIGMPLRQVTDTAGQPTDQGAYITGKAFIPFYFGSDRYRYELVYKGQGRLIFAGGSAGDLTGAHLIWIIYSPSEGGYR